VPADCSGAGLAAAVRWAARVSAAAVDIRAAEPDTERLGPAPDGATAVERYHTETVPPRELARIGLSMGRLVRRRQVGRDRTVRAGRRELPCTC
jgi:hypothetical protein